MKELVEVCVLMQQKLEEVIGQDIKEKYDRKNEVTKTCIECFEKITRK